MISNVRFESMDETVLLTHVQALRVSAPRFLFQLADVVPWLIFEGDATRPALLSSLHMSAICGASPEQRPLVNFKIRFQNLNL